MPLSFPLRRLALAALPLLASACAPLFGPHNDLLSAGFASRRADTPARQAMLVRLPPHVFIRRLHGRTLSYAFADPAACDCLYMGSARAYRRYVRRTERVHGTAAASLAAVDYVNGVWDWDAWGGFRPGFTWGPGFGWGDRPRPMDLGAPAP